MAAGSASEVVELRPNLQPLPASEFRLETNGSQTYLRFTTTSRNSGQIALEVVAEPSDPNNSNGSVQAYQRLFDDEGNEVRHEGIGKLEYHDAVGHEHYHFVNYANYLLEPESPGPGRLASKTTFCIIDTDRIDHKLDGAPKRAHYTRCGTEIQGMSVGWGDSYRYYLEGQSFDVTDLAPGRYTVTIVIDPQDRIRETNDSDNTSVVTIDLDPDAGTVTVVDDSGPSNGNGNGNGRGRR
jgi:hypothetical protein